MITLSMLLTGQDLHCVEPLALWDFRKLFLPNVGEDQKKKSYHLSAELLALPNGKPLLVIALRLQKGIR